MKLIIRINKILVVFTIVIYALTQDSYSQVLRMSLQEAQQKARIHYPLAKGKEFLDRIEVISIENLAKGYLPQFSLNGQATYQSDVTAVNIPIPGISIKPMDKDQYKLTGDVSQMIFDGGAIKEQQLISKLNTDVQKQQLEVSLYQLKERVNQVYLSVLYLDEQLKQVGLIASDLQTGINRTEAQVNNGVILRSNLDVLKAEQLRNKQRTIELQASRDGLIETLALLIGEQLSPGTVLDKPAAPSLNRDIARPELTLFSSRQKLLEQQKGLLQSRNMPHVNLFGQGGYGKPGLNMLNSQFDWFYLAGLRLNWTFGGLYTLKNEREQIDLNKMMVGLEQESFVLNTQTQLSQQAAEIKKQQQLLDADEEIIVLREKIITAAKAQLENGVITANDYLREINAADQARQNRITHSLLLLQAQINYQNIAGY